MLFMKKVLQDRYASKNEKYLLQVKILDVHTERTITSYVSHVSSTAQLVGKVIEPKGALLIYHLTFERKDTDLIKSILTIQGVSHASLTKDE